MRIQTLAGVAFIFLVSCAYYPSPSPVYSNPVGNNPNAQAGVLTAADIDENLNLNSLQKYLNEQLQQDKNQILPSLNTVDRVAIDVRDSQGLGMSNARVQIFDGATLVLESLTGANGIFYFYPSYDTVTAKQLTIKVQPPTGANPALETALNLETLSPERRLQINLSQAKSSDQALDLMLVIDATGSMGDEMQYLSKEFQAITQAITSKFPTVSTRFALTVYRDKGDEYVVRAFDFTDSVALMQKQLAAQSAQGGGDYPEAMEQALGSAVQAQWRSGNTNRLIFLVADAPPHDQDLSKAIIYAKAARKQGIRIYPLAASGVANTAEYLMRIMAVTTHGRYLFLTDDSGVGNTHSEPKIPCYITTRLDHLLTRVVSSELSGTRVEATQDQIIRNVGQQNAGVCN
ncbi:MAG: hypothetical protein RLZZ156_581 [Deinococcota bacterium]